MKFFTMPISQLCRVLVRKMGKPAKTVDSVASWLGIVLGPSSRQSSVLSRSAWLGFRSADCRSGLAHGPWEPLCVQDDQSGRSGRSPRKLQQKPPGLCRVNFARIPQFTEENHEIRHQTRHSPEIGIAAISLSHPSNGVMYRSKEGIRLCEDLAHSSEPFNSHGTGKRSTDTWAT